MCKEWQLGKNCQVDHFPIDAGSIPNIEAVGTFANNLFCEVDNLRCLCKTCHSQYTLSQRKGISLEQAALEKQVTELSKLSVAKQLAWLASKGVVGEKTSNAVKRKAEIMKILKGEQI